MLKLISPLLLPLLFLFPIISKAQNPSWSEFEEKVNAHFSNNNELELIEYLKQIERNPKIVDTVYWAAQIELFRINSIYGDAQENIELVETAIDSMESIYAVGDLVYCKYVGILSQSYIDLGMFDKSEALILKVLEQIPDSIDYYSIQVKLLSSLSTIYRDKDAYQESLDLLQEALNICKKEPETLGIASSVVHTNIATIYYYLKEYSLAAKKYNEAIEQMQKYLEEEDKDLLTTRLNLANVYIDTRELEKSKVILLDIINILEKSNQTQHVNYTHATRFLAAVYLMMGNEDKALELHQKALETLEQRYGNRYHFYADELVSLTETYLTIGNFEKAYQTLKEGIAANSMSLPFDFKQWDEMLNHDYLSYRILQLQENQAYYLNEIRDTASFKIPDPEGLIQSFEKIRHKKIREINSDKDKLKMLANEIYSSIEYMKCLWEMDSTSYKADLFEVSEFYKGVMIAQATQGEDELVFGKLTKEFREEEKKIRKLQNDLKAQNAAAKTKEERDQIISEQVKFNRKVKQFYEKLETEYPEHSKIRYNYKSATYESLKDKIDDKSLIIEYLFGVDYYYIFALSKKEFKVYRLPFSFHFSELNQRIDSLHQTLSDYSALSKKALQTENYQTYTQNAYWLYEKLLKPVLKEQEGIEHLIIIPDLQLGNLPLEALLSQAAPKKMSSYEDLNYLLKEYSFSYNYSATLWQDNQGESRRKNNGQILGVAANYDFKTNETVKATRSAQLRQLREVLQPLPAARKEVESLQTQFRGLYLFDSLANEQNFKQKAGKYSVIHLAMHGLLNPQSELLSSLAFTETNDPNSDDFLHAYEISQMELNADLVVLSACETGYGRFEEGNGIASLARAFMYAGVPALVVSLWQVNDDATAIIMTSFYNELSKGKGKADALQIAKLDYLNRAKGLGAHPAFWSPFILLGNEDPISLGASFVYWPWFLGLAILLLLGGSILLFRKRRKDKD